MTISNDCSICIHWLLITRPNNSCCHGWCCKTTYREAQSIQPLCGSIWFRKVNDSAVTCCRILKTTFSRHHTVQSWWQKMTDGKCWIETQRSGGRRWVMDKTQVKLLENIRYKTTWKRKENRVIQYRENKCYRNICGGILDWIEY